MSNMLIGVGTQKGEDGKLYGIMQIAIDDIAGFTTRFTSEDSFEQDIASIIGGLMQVRNDFKEHSAGIIVVPKGGMNDATLRNPQGGKQSSPRKPRT